MNTGSTHTYTLNTATLSNEVEISLEKLRENNERLQSQLSDLKEGQRRMEEAISRKDETIYALREELAKITLATH